MTQLSAYSSPNKRGKLGASIDDFLAGKHSEEEAKREFKKVKQFVIDVFKMSDIKIYQENFIGLFSEGYKQIQKNLFNKEYNKFQLMTFTSVLKMPVECYLKQYNDRTEFWIDYPNMNSATKLIISSIDDVYKGLLLALGIEVAMVEKYL